MTQTDKIEEKISLISILEEIIKNKNISSSKKGRIEKLLAAEKRLKNLCDEMEKHLKDDHSND